MCSDAGRGLADVAEIIVSNLTLNQQRIAMDDRLETECGAQKYVQREFKFHYTWRVDFGKW